MKDVKLKWHAFRFDSNKHKLEFVNVLQGMEEQIAVKIKKGAKDNWKPVVDYGSFKDWLRSEFMYYYWCKAEHETVIGGLFYHDEENLEKHDIWWQLEPNLDRICEYIIKEMNIKF